MEHEPQPEHLNSRETAAELEKLAETNAAEYEQLTERPETGRERAEAARAKIEQQADNEPGFEESTPKPKPITTRLDKIAAYRDTMASLQRKLSPASRQFSRFIHSPAVEKTSEVVGNTVLRPSVTLGATVTALVVVTSVYLAAKHYGFALSGSELPLSLVAGGIIGYVLELISRFVKRR